MICPNCNKENPDSSKFCLACGANISAEKDAETTPSTGREDTQDVGHQKDPLCPECGRESPVHKQICDNCGTDVEVFFKIQETLERMRRYTKEKKWNQVSEEYGLLPANVQLPGETGRSMQREVEQLFEQAQPRIQETKNLKPEIDRLIRGEAYEDAMPLVEKYCDINPHDEEMQKLQAQMRDLMEDRDYRRAFEEVQGALKEENFETARNCLQKFAETYPETENGEKVQSLVDNELRVLEQDQAITKARNEERYGDLPELATFLEEGLSILGDWNESVLEGAPTPAELHSRVQEARLSAGHYFCGKGRLTEAAAQQEKLVGDEAYAQQASDLAAAIDNKGRKKRKRRLIIAGGATTTFILVIALVFATEKMRLKSRYETKMQDGREAMTAGDLDKANAAFQAALNVKGYAEDKKAELKLAHLEYQQALQDVNVPSSFDGSPQDYLKQYSPNQREDIIAAVEKAERLKDEKNLQAAAQEYRHAVEMVQNSTDIADSHHKLAANLRRDLTRALSAREAGEWREAKEAAKAHLPIGEDAPAACRQVADNLKALIQEVGQKQARAEYRQSLEKVNVSPSFDGSAEDYLRKYSPDQWETVVSAIEKAERLEQDKKWERAARKYEYATESLDECRYQAKIEQGRQAMQADNWDEALNAFQAVFKVEGDTGNTVAEQKLEELVGEITKAAGNDATRLHWAAREGNADLLEWLINKGADIDIKGKHNATPLHLAAMRGDREVTELLLNKGAATEAKTKIGRTPFYLAAFQGYVEVAALLLDKGANINAKAYDGTTPLHWAARQGHTDIVELLINRGATVNIQAEDGKTPLDFAMEKDNTDIAKILRKHGAKRTSSE